MHALHHPSRRVRKGGCVADVYVDVEQGDLDTGAGMIFASLKNGRIRVMYDPGTMTETEALRTLRQQLGSEVIRSSST